MKENPEFGHTVRDRTGKARVTFLPVNEADSVPYKVYVYGEAKQAFATFSQARQYLRSYWAVNLSA
jgi:hypothetical protein